MCCRICLHLCVQISKECKCERDSRQLCWYPWRCIEPKGFFMYEYNSLRLVVVPGNPHKLHWHRGRKRVHTPTRKLLRWRIVRDNWHSMVNYVHLVGLVHGLPCNSKHSYGKWCLDLPAAMHKHVLSNLVLCDELRNCDYPLRIPLQHYWETRFSVTGTQRLWY